MVVTANTATAIFVSRSRPWLRIVTLPVISGPISWTKIDNGDVQSLQSWVTLVRHNQHLLVLDCIDGQVVSCGRLAKHGILCIAKVQSGNLRVTVFTEMTFSMTYKFLNCNRQITDTVTDNHSHKRRSCFAHQTWHLSVPRKDRRRWSCSYS